MVKQSVRQRSRASAVLLATAATVPLVVGVLELGALRLGGAAADDLDGRA